MKYSLKMIVSIIFIFVLIVTSSLATFAEQSFTDVPEDYWANPFVEKVSKMQAMPGYEDATFKPTNEVSRLEAIISIYNVLKATGKIEDVNEEALVLKYYSIIENVKLPKELEPYGKISSAVAYALENDIIETAELKAFIKDGKLLPAKKIDTIVFIAKALNIFRKENLKNSDKIISFDFEDDTDISSVATNYVYFLIENNVISGKGNSEGKLLPKIITTRQLLAAMLCGFNDAILSEEIEADLPNKEINGSGIGLTGSYRGTIDAVYPLEKLVRIKDSNNKLTIFDIENSKILMNNKELSYQNLEQGQEVKLTLINGKMMYIEILKDFDKYEGTFLKFSILLNDVNGSYKVLTMKKDNLDYGYFKVRDSSKIYINGDEAKLDDIKASDRIILIAENDKLEAKEISVVSKTSEKSGILLNSSELKLGDFATLKLSDGQTIEQKIDNNIAIKTYGDKAIQKGEIVKIVFEFGEIVRIEGTGMGSEDVGKIKEILISKTPKITILRENGDLKTYPISKDVQFIVDSGENDLGIYGLRLEQNLNLKMDATGVVSISAVTEAKESEEKIKTNGEIIEIFKTTNNLKLRDSDGKIWTIGVKSGSGVSILEYRVGDSIYVVGMQLSNEFIEAELIIKL